jgi:asparagine synthase (glutamine-hydrolysing)
MSAIFGMINKNGRPVDQQRANKIQQAMLHRATDGKGTYLSGNVFLSHHKLIISPAQQNEAMPLEQDGFVITADARIDNREELANRLGLNKEHGLLPADHILILSAFKKWAGKCVTYLEGEFAFAIWNTQTSSLFCATDHIGFRPLYYYDTADAFIFCSEMKGILAVKETPNIFNEEALVEYFFRQSNQTKTYNDEVFALCGGNTLTLQYDKLTIGKYWSPQKTGKYHFTKDSDWANCLRDLLTTAIDNRLQTDLPVGITLSGGLDSSSVACIAGRILEKRNKPLYAFSSVLPQGYKGVEVDERKYIDIIGRHIKNLEQTFVEVPEAGPFTGLEEAFNLEETIPNAFFYMDRALHKAAQEKNVRVFLTGFGGDLFVSHKGHQVIYQLIKQLKLADAAKIFVQTKKIECSYLQILKTDYLAFTWLYKFYTAARGRSALNWQLFTPLKDDLTKKYLKHRDSGPVKDQAAWMTKYIASGQMGRLMGMFANRYAAYDMEAAVPLLDKSIMEFLLDVPVEQFRIGGARRSLMRRAMEGILPPEVQWRADKTPYSPDYVSRIIREKELIRATLTSGGPAKNYIESSRILGHIDHLQPRAGMSDPKEVSAIRIAQGIICIFFINWLDQQEYRLK